MKVEQILAAHQRALRESSAGWPADQVEYAAMRALVADLARVYTVETDQAPLLALVQRARQLMEGR